MFNLEQSIVEWRKQMLAAGVNSPVPLEELEMHLREDICNLVASGQTEAAAFQIAVARVGNPGTMGSEFKKTGPRWSTPFVIGSLVWAALAAGCMAAIAGRWAEGKINFLLTAHIFSLTMGYVTAFLAGGFGIYGVCRQWLRAVSTSDQQMLNGVIRLFTQMSAALVVAGFVLGMLWSSQNHRTIWTNEPREISALCAVVWLVAVTSAQCYGQLNYRKVVRSSIAGNLVVALAWFEAVAPHHGYNLVSCWPLDAWLGVHLFFLGMSATSGSRPVEA